MQNIAFIVLCTAGLAFSPPLIGYARRLGHGTMMLIWLWLLLPVLGWLIALSLALTEKPPGQRSAP